MKNRINRLFRRRAIDAEVREEIETHVAMRAELNRQAGMPEDEALRAARRQFGNPTSVREQIYHFNGFGSLDAFGRDLRSSMRTLRRYPGVTLLALLSLALGIGANTLAFSFVNVLLFHALPYPNSDRLVMTDDGITSAECLALREKQNDVLEEFGCFAGSALSGASIADDNPGSLLPEHLFGQQFTASMGRALAVQPQIGRWFSEADEVGTAGRVMVISYRLWHRRFGGSSDVLGKPVRVDGELVTIIGVMPDEFEFMSSRVDYWLPFRTQAAGVQSSAPILGAVGRLRQNATLEQAQAVMDAVVAPRTTGASKGKEQTRILFTRMDQLAWSQYQDSAFVLQGAVAFVLLIACANVAGLLLTQAMSQQRELAVRAALGSGVWRIVRQVLIHSVLLFVVGGVLGLAVGWAGVRLMVNVVLPSNVMTYGEPRGGIPRAVYETNIDGTVLVFTFAISLVCGLAAAIGPALQISRAQPLDVLKEANPGATSGIARQKLRSVFVSTQIALAFVLLVGAALMLKGLTLSLGQDIGFDPAGLLTVHVQFPVTPADEAVRLDPKVVFNSEQIRQQLTGIAGGAAATGIAIYPPMSGAINVPIEVEGQSQNERRSQFIPILPDYFKTLQVSVVEGREFEMRDNAENLPVAVINEAAARLFWPNENPLGKSIRIRSDQLPGEPSRQIIGVVTEVMQYSFQESRPQLYVPYGQLQIIKNEGLSSQLHDMTFILRTPRGAAEMATDIGAAIGRADRNQAASGIRSMQQNAFAGSQRRSTFVMLIGLFGAIAVVLAVIGVYGVMVNMVNQRFNELGVRIALGADRSQIRRLVIRHGSVVIGIGLLGGLLVSLAVTRVLRSFLFGTSPTDPLTFTFGVVLLGGVALLACYIPARRASRIDPIVALRHY